ncbi:MAG: DNA-binding response regulator [Chloroflexi bacterium]|nr:MAG: DNA-binding response regulator [Chloroflexota bacterium]
MKTGEDSPTIRLTTTTERLHDSTDLTPNLVRILLADAHKLMRQGLCHLFKHEPAIQIVGEANTPAEAYKLNRVHQPDLVLLDIAMAEPAGTETVSTLLCQRPNTRVLVLTALDDDQTALRALKAGAVGYLLKDIAFSDLVKAIYASLQGGTPLHPRIARVVLRRLNQPPARPDPLSKLTARERQVLDLLAQGYSNSEIAHELVITQFTVRSHVCRVLKKLNLVNRTQAALYLLKHGSSSLMERPEPSR